MIERSELEAWVGQLEARVSALESERAARIADPHYGWDRVIAGGPLGANPHIGTRPKETGDLRPLKNTRWGVTGGGSRTGI